MNALLFGPSYFVYSLKQQKYEYFYLDLNETEKLSATPGRQVSASSYVLKLGIHILAGKAC